MKLYDVNIFDWGGYEGWDKIEICLDAYPVFKTEDGYYDTDTSADPIKLVLTEDEAKAIGVYYDHTDTWEHSDSLAERVVMIAPRVYTWLKSLPDTKEN